MFILGLGLKRPRLRPHAMGIVTGVSFSVLALGPLLLATAMAGGYPEAGDAGYLGLTELSFGFKAGVSFAQHVGTEERDVDYEVSSAWRKGYAIGGFLSFPVTSRFSLQQEVLYIQKGSQQYIGVEILEVPTVLNVTYDIEYIEIPVLLKFAWMKWELSELYSFAGTALSLKVNDRYRLEGEVTDGDEVIPLRADSDMSEVDMFDFSFAYGFGMEFPLFGRRALMEYRFTMGWNTLAMPTYAYVPVGEDEILIDNKPVPLKNQNHVIMLGITF